MKKLLLILFFCIVAGIFVVVGQKHFSNIEHFSINNGLSQGTVNCLLLDSQGFLWIGTMDGLNKYDGYQFKIYRHDPIDSSSISSNFIYSIDEDDNGIIWIATQYGLNKYNPKTDSFDCYTRTKGNPYTLSENNVYNVFAENSNTIWVKTSIFIEQLDVRTGRFFTYKPKHDYLSNISDHNNFAILRDSHGSLWVGTKDGLNLFDNQSDVFKHYAHYDNRAGSISNNQIRAIYEDKKYDVLWIGTDFGLNKYNRNTDDFNCYYLPTDGNNETNIVSAICRTSNNKLWIGTRNGIFLFNEKDKKFEKFTEGSFADNQPKQNRINAFIEDSSKILWVGTWNGLYKLDSKKEKFQLYRNKVNVDYEMLDNDIRAILVDTKNRLWLGYRSRGLSLVNDSRNFSVHYSTSNVNRKLVGNHVQVIFEDNNSQIWIGTDNGVQKYNETSQQFEEIEGKNSMIKDDVLSTKINDIYQTKDKSIWFASNTGLHNLQNGQLNSFFSDIKDTNSVSANEIYTLIEDKDGIIWIGTINGLNRFDRKTKLFKQYTKALLPPQRISNNSVLSLYEDSKGIIWVGTESGLNRFDKQLEEFTYYTQKDGFSNDYIYSILEDKSNNLWLSTNHGLTRFTPTNVEVVNYDIVDGLQSYEFNFGASFKGKDGKFYFGGVNGFNSFFPDSIVPNEHIKKVKIISITSHSQEGKKNQIVNQNCETYIFSHRDYMFSIEFALLEFTHPERNQYEYKMQGLNDEWIRIKSDNKATFPNIPAGNYIFSVRASNSDNIWAEEAATIRIIVNPPLWKTKIAYIIYILLGTVVIYSLFLYITRNLRQANQILKEKEKTAIKIAKQKEELSIKNQNITDSLNYAQRIIKAMTPSSKMFKRQLPDSFILLKPKDIVSGDFYWIAEKNNKIFIAAVDCTGHGIPGAFMSIIGLDLLRNIVKVQGIEDAAEVLNYLNFGVAETFRDAEDMRVNDGMDITLCIIDKVSRTVQYAGAYNPLYLIRDNKITEIKANRFSVGMATEKNDQRFDAHTFSYREKDVIYLFTDGYMDQFGGTDGKKFKFRRFRHLLLTIHNQPLSEQKDILDKSIEAWRGNREQVDDILIIGIRPGTKI